MTTTHTVRHRGGGAAALLLLLATGCADAGADDASPPTAAGSPAAATTPEPSGSSSAWTGDRVPEGTWTRTATAADARAVGLTPSETELGTDGRLPLVVRLTGDRFGQFGEYRPGQVEDGDAGSVAYDDGGRLVLTSESEGCPGCVAALTWRLDGDRLELTKLSGRVVEPMDRFIWLGTWHRS